MTSKQNALDFEGGDPDGDPLRVVEVGSPSTLGGELTLMSCYVGYRPPSGNVVNDSFSFTVLAGLSDRREVASGLSSLEGLRVTLRVSGDFNGDLYAYLRHESVTGTNFCVLLNRVGRTAADVWGYDDPGLEVTFEAGAANGNIHLYRDVAAPAPGTWLTGVWEPDGRSVSPLAVVDTDVADTSLSTFVPADPSGVWTLFVADVDGGALHTLESWSLEFYGKLIPTVDWADPVDLVYGTALDGTQLNAVVSVPGTAVYDPPPGTVLNAGAGQVLSMTFTPEDSGLYAGVTRSVLVDVLPKELVVTPVDVTKVYGAPLPQLTATWTGFVDGESEVDLTSPLVLHTVAGAESPVGEYAITASGADGSNYSVTFGSGVMSVTPAAAEVSVSAVAVDIPPGEALGVVAVVVPVATGFGFPSGDVQFLVDGVDTGVAVALVNGEAAATLTGLAVGPHSVSARYLGGVNFLGADAGSVVEVLVNTPPVAVDDVMERGLLTDGKVLLSVLLSNDTDADGHLLQLVSMAAVSAHGGAVAVEGDWVHYTPAAGWTNADSFTYRVADAYGATAEGTVQVTVTNGVVDAPNLHLSVASPGVLLLRFDGVPGQTYRVEWAGDPSGLWSLLGEAMASETGAFEITDAVAGGAGSRFYRCVSP